MCGNVLGMCWTRGDGDGDGDGREVERAMDRDACDWLGGGKRDVEKEEGGDGCCRAEDHN